MYVCSLRCTIFHGCAPTMVLCARNLKYEILWFRKPCTMEIIKLFWVNTFMPVTKFPHLTIYLFFKRRLFWIFGQIRGCFKETNGKNWGFCVEKERERKKRMVKVVKSCHQPTWAQKRLTEKTEWTFNFKIFKYE